MGSAVVHLGAGSTLFLAEECGAFAFAVDTVTEAPCIKIGLAIDAPSLGAFVEIELAAGHGNFYVPQWVKFSTCSEFASQTAVVYSALQG